MVSSAPTSNYLSATNSVLGVENLFLFFYLCIMKHLIDIFLTFALLLSVSALYAEEPSSALRFQSTTHDFGHIREDGGEQLCTFVAINEGDGTIKVTNIETSCGCTSASYNKGEIAPNDRFEVSVCFDPFNRPGRIEKHIFVTVSDSERPIRLLLEGFVQERERTIDELYPFDMGGGLRLRSNFHAFGYTEHGSTVEEHIGYINTSLEPIAISINHTTTSGWLTVTHPAMIPAGSTGDITLCYTIPEECAVYGTISDTLYIIIDGIKARYPLSAEAIVTDNFSMVDDISAPRADISKNIIKFGEIKHSKETFEEMITLTNSGASPLMVRHIESSSEAVEGIAESDTLQPNESTKIRIRLHGESIELIEGIFTARLRIVTNDPIRPMQTIKVNAIID